MNDPTPSAPAALPPEARANATPSLIPPPHVVRDRLAAAGSARSGSYADFSR